MQSKLSSNVESNICSVKSSTVLNLRSSYKDRPTKLSMEQQQPNLQYQPRQPPHQPIEQYGHAVLGPQSHQPPYHQGPRQALLPSPPTYGRSSRHACAVKTLAVFQLVLAVLSTQVGVIAIILYSSYAYTGAPVWSGLLFYLPAGILGLMSVKATISEHGRSGLAISCMVMSILAACVSFANTALGAIAISRDIHLGDNTGSIVCDGISVIIGVCELVIAIIAASFCCLIMGELRSTNNTNIQYAPTFIPGSAMNHHPAYNNYGTSNSQMTAATATATPTLTVNDNKVDLV